MKRILLLAVVALFIGACSEINVTNSGGNPTNENTPSQPTNSGNTTNPQPTITEPTPQG